MRGRAVTPGQRGARAAGRCVARACLRDAECRPWVCVCVCSCRGGRGATQSPVQPAAHAQGAMGQEARWFPCRMCSQNRNQSACFGGQGVGGKELTWTRVSARGARSQRASKNWPWSGLGSEAADCLMGTDQKMTRSLSCKEVWPRPGFPHAEGPIRQTSRRRRRARPAAWRCQLHRGWGEGCRGAARGCPGGAQTSCCCARPPRGTSSPARVAAHTWLGAWWGQNNRSSRKASSARQHAPCTAHISWAL